MGHFINLSLTRNDVGQIIEGLEERRLIWQATYDYLKFGFTDCGQCIEECSNPHEAEAIADHYQCIIDSVKKQLVEQLTETPRNY